MPADWQQIYLKVAGKFTSVRIKLIICWQILLTQSERLHTLTKKQKTEKQQPIRIRAGKENKKQKLSTTSASSDWLLLFCFLLFCQGVNLVEVFLLTIMIATTTNILLLLLEILLLILKIIYYICEEVYRFIIPTEKKSVAGEIVLITGAGHGIGKELAIGYASLGATVVCWDINEQPNNETMNEIKRMGKESVYAYRCDVTDREEVFRVAEKVKKEVGDVTLLVNNAGITFVKTLMNYSPDEITQVLNVNLISNYWTMKAFLPSMIEKNYGHIVSVNTIAGLVGDCYGTVYCTSKFAVRGLMEAMSEELRKLSNGKSSIKFTTVYPTFVKTGLTKSPKFRFPFMREFTSQETASSIIDAQRRNYTNISIPTYWLRSFKVLRLLPEGSMAKPKRRHRYNYYSR